MKKAPENIVVAACESAICKESEDVLLTYLEGAGTAVTFYDSQAHIGGLLHYLYPTTKDGQKSMSPYQCADTGIEKTLFSLIDNGADWDQLVIKLCGALACGQDVKVDMTSKRNILAARKVFWRLGLFVHSQDVGGQAPRDLSLHMTDGTVTVKKDGTERKI